ncbi:LPXTG cell wall anchor domain-containing protein [Leifsonia sp. ZF2019]|uniref:LPXTG cell wall anchor domain-containing protein n=1 Tax=Leifsonia sp. ZF2019 TaxID=2781978 RepID=UPI001CBDBE57|nr:LPXTG cell wall anchor domain-containing protein [Leifsonia sp. ZF2019]
MNSTKNTTWAARAAALGLSAVIAGGMALVASAPAQAAPATAEVHQQDIRSNEDTYPGWHQGYANAEDRAVVGANGLELTGESQILYGYTEQERLTGAQLESLVQAGGVSWKTSWNSAYFQLPLFYGDATAPKFTTLRPASPVEGTNTAALTDTWVTSTAITDADGAPLYAKNDSATLGDFLAALDVDTVQVLGFGVLTEAGTQADVDSVTFNGTTYSFVPTGTATVAGAATVGTTLTVSPAGFPEGSQFSYQWFASSGQSGSELSSTTDSYTVTDAEVGMSVGVIVTATLAGHTTAWVRSSTTGVVTAPQKPAAAAPVPNSDALPAYLAANGVTPGTPLSAGLPATLDPTKGYTASVEWTSADSFVDVYVYSTPILLGSFPVVDGKVQVTLSADVLAQLAAGSHTLVLVGQSSGGVQAVALSVAAVTTTAALAATGSDAAIPATIGGLLVLLGAAGVLVARRRRSAQA